MIKSESQKRDVVAGMAARLWSAYVIARAACPEKRDTLFESYSDAAEDAMWLYAEATRKVLAERRDVPKRMARGNFRA